MHPFICARSGGNMDDNGPNESNVKVAVRVRPTNRRGRCTNHVIVFFFFFSPSSKLLSHSRQISPTPPQKGNSKVPLEPPCVGSVVFPASLWKYPLCPLFGNVLAELPWKRELGGKDRKGHSDITSWKNGGNNACTVSCVIHLGLLC